MNTTGMMQIVNIEKKSMAAMPAMSSCICEVLRR